MKKKYKITFYKFYGIMFTKICSSTWYSAFSSALKTTFKQGVTFKIEKIRLVKL